MVDLTGEFAREAQEVLRDLHLGIAIGRNIVTATHNFELKLLAVDTVIMHMHANYTEHEELVAFFMEISDEIVQLRDQLQALEKGEIHVIMEEESSTKKGVSWILKHRKEVATEVAEEAAISKRILQKVHKSFKRLKEKFTEVDHLFSVNIKKATVTKVKIDLAETEEELKHILEQLLGFFMVYEKMFKEELERLGKR